MVDLIEIQSPGGARFKVSADRAPAFLGLVTELEQRGYPINPGNVSSYRPGATVAGTGGRSQHADANAVDVNASLNRVGTRGNIPPDLANELANKYGARWGGNFRNPDPMHFDFKGAPVAMAATAPSVDDLLARVEKLAPATPSSPAPTQTTAEAPAPSAADLLARVDTMAPPPPTAAEQKAAKGPDNTSGPYSEFGDLSAQPWAQGKPVEEGTVAPIVRGIQGAGPGFIQGATEGWKNTEPFLTPYAQNALADTGPISRQITLPLVHLADAAHGGVNALMQGVTGAIGAGTEAAGAPRLGQDINALLQVAPMAGFGTGVPRVAEAPKSLARPQFVSERAAPPREPGATDAARIKQLIEHDTAETAPAGPPEHPETPTPEIPATTAGVATGEPHPAWVGNTVGQIKSLVEENAAAGGPKDLSAAATPQELATMSPAMAKAYRRMAEVNRVVSPIEGEDGNVYVHGSIPTRAEKMGNPAESQKEVMTRQRAPEAFEGPQGRLTQNDAARTRLYDDQTLSDPQIETLNEDQARQAKKDTAAVITKAGPVDATAEAARLKQVLSDPRIREQPDVVKVLQPIHDALYDADGKLKTDIQSFWGMHDNLMQKLAKAKDPLQASSSEKFAFNQILDAKNAVDDLMNKASGGEFQKFLDNQAEFFKSKNAATILRDFRTKMINPKTGMIDGNRFHRFVTDLAVRRGKPGIDAAMDIPDEVFGRLMDIDDDLKRAGRIDLGKPRGSATNLYFELAQGLGIAGAHSLVSGMGPLANVGLQVGIGALQRRIGAANLNRLVRNALDDQAERPPPNPNPPGQFVPPAARNPLTPPSAP